jgi:hypothetical protein
VLETQYLSKHIRETIFKLLNKTEHHLTNLQKEE